MPAVVSATFASVKTLHSLENDRQFADHRHPVDFIEPLPPTPAEDQLQRVCEVLSRTFGWVAQATTVEQKGLRASVVLYCVRADLLGEATLEELGATVGTPPSCSRH